MTTIFCPRCVDIAPCKYIPVPDGFKCHCATCGLFIELVFDERQDFGLEDIKELEDVL